MNKHCYRMVFNKVRGILMAVAEIASSHSRASGETSGKTVAPGAVRGRILRAVVFSAWATLIWPSIGQAQIVADPSAPANQRPTILAAPNGVPLVNIQTPSAAGISRNTYSQFDVQQQGAILNNSRTDAQTQLGGWVQGNPWLATGSARVILNEVNSSNPSLLQGYVEVAGSRAQVVIANPAGVTCDGCGFINSNRVTLTTGTPILNGGSLDGYRVQSGIINITGAGLDTSTADYTDLIARAVQVNAGIWANQLTVTAGANQVDAAHAVATPIAGTGATPAFAIDVAQLGGMYAGKITLVGTEAGVGVRNAGNIGASVGEVIVTAEGRLENAGRITSASHTQIDTQDGIQNSGTIYAQGNASLGTRDNIDNSGVIAAQGNTTLAATGANSQIVSTNSSVLGAGVQTDGSIGASGTLSVSATQTVTAQGQNLSGGDQTVAAQAIDLTGSQTSGSDLHLSASHGDINLTGATIAVSQIVTANASQTLRTDHATLSAMQINASAHDLSNVQGEIIQVGSGDLTLNMPGNVDNTHGVLATNGSMNIVAASLDNSDGTIYGTGNLTVQSGGVLNNQRGLIQTEANLDVVAVTAVKNVSGRIEANGAGSSAVVSGASIDNTAGRIINSGIGTTVVNGGTSIVNNNTANIQGIGVIGGNGEVEINAANLANTQGGQVVAGGNLNFNVSAALNNSTGMLYAQTNLTVNQPGATLTNVGGHIGASGNIDLAVMSLDNTNGMIGNIQDSGGNLAVLTTGNVTNTGGEIFSAQDLRMTANTLVGDGVVIGGRDASLSLQGDYTQTAANVIAANRDVSFSTTGILTNAGTLQAVSNLVVNADNINNQGELSAGDKLSANTSTLRNTGSIIGGDVTITASQKIENVGPTALIGASNALGKLELLAPIIENRDETTATDTSALTTIFGLGQVVLAGSKDAVSGQYASASQVTNSSGLIESGGDMLIYANTLTNTRRSLETTNDFTQIGQASGSVVWTIANPDVPGGCYIDPPHGGTWNSHYVQTDYTETQYRNSLVSVSPEAQIISGGNLNPAVNLLQNYWSKITAAGDISLNGVTLDQDSWRGATPYLQRSVYNGTYLYQTYKGIYWRATWLGPQIIDTPLSGYDSSLTAQGNISGSGATIHNTAGSSSFTPLGMQAGQAIQSASGAPVGLVGQSPVGANLSLPQGGLFHTNIEPQARYLVETNPAFANRTAWLSSDWYFQQLGMNPTMIQKRLGDGFYEQKLIREAILSLTGKTLLGGYVNEEAQFREMMTSGATLVQSLEIRPGVSLNAEQVAKLTSNVIIMETRVVDGNSVLVPVVYLARINQDDLLSTGPMIAAANINLNNTKTFTNSGTIKANNALSLSGQAIDNRGGNLQSGGLMALNTAGNIDLTSANVKAGSLQLQTGSDLKLNTDAKNITTIGPNGSRTKTMLGRVGSVETTGDAQIETGGNFEQKGGQLKVGGDLAANITGDWQLTAQQTRETTSAGTRGGRSNTDVVQNIGSVVETGGNADIRTGGNFTAQGAQINLKSGGSIQAGGSVELLAVKNSVAVDSATSGKDHSAALKTYDETVVGTSLQSGGNLSVTSGKDIRLSGSSLTVSQGGANLAAAGDVAVEAATEQHTYDWQHSGTHFGGFNSRTTNEQAHVDSAFAKGSSVSADTVTVTSGKDIAVIGSNVVGTNDVALTASNNINIASAASTQNESHYKETTKSGLLDSGFGFTIGSQTKSTDSKGATVTANASTVGSIEGSVTIVAGKDYKQVGSDVLAPQGDIDISAKKIDIVEAQNTSRNDTETKFSKAGLTIALTSPILSALETVSQMGKAASQTKDPRMQALAGATAGLATKNAYDAVTANPGAGMGTTSVGVSISIGGSSNTSNSTQTSSTAAGSTVAAGHDINLTATGAGKDSDLTIQGGTVKAGNNVTLQADDEINLLAAKSTNEQHSKDKSLSGSIGVSVGSQTGVTIGLSVGKGKADGSDETWTNTHVEAGNKLSLESGGDTTMKGAVASGKQVVADVGGNLNIESLQDTSKYDSKQQSAGGSVTIGPVPGASLSLSKSSAHSDYASVTEQSGIKAGDEGFQVNVNGNTDLKGAVIASTEQAVQDGKNILTTATLTTSDIQNRADASAKSSGINLDSSMLTQGKYGIAKGVIGNALNNASESGSSSGQTRSAVSDGTVNITDEAGQQQRTGKTAEQTVASLNRDTANAQTAAQKQDVQAMEQTVAAERAIKQEAIKQATVLTDAVYRSATGAKKVMLEKCDSQGQNCNAVEVDMKDHQLVHGSDGKVYLFNHGINNTEAQALGAAAEQNSPQALEQGVYVVINPHTGNVISEVLYAAWDKTLAPVFGISNASEMRNDVIMQARDQGYVVDEGNHSRGNITSFNGQQQLAREGITDAPISYVQLNGSPINAQEMQGVMDQTTSGKAKVYQSTHRNDWVGTFLGNNPETGGQASGFIDAHTGYGPNMPKDKSDKIWGPGIKSLSMPTGEQQ